MSVPQSFHSSSFFQTLKGDQLVTRLGDKKSLRTGSISSVLSQLQSPYSQRFFLPGRAFSCKPE